MELSPNRGNNEWVHSGALNDCVWTNFVMLLSVPISVVVSTCIRIVWDTASAGIMTFTIRYLFKHADVHTHAHFACAVWVGVCSVSQQRKLKWDALVVVAACVHYSDLCGCVQPSWALHQISLHNNLFVDWPRVNVTCFVHTHPFLCYLCWFCWGLSASLCPVSFPICLAFYTPRQPT